jgi:hypothetical protein
MIELALELIDNGGYDYWDIVNSYARNQLAENQIKDGSFITEDNSRKDKDGCTWKNMSKRVVGGWSGGALPNSISLARFRSIAGCCVGTAPQALQMVWDRIVEQDGDEIYINLPMERDSEAAKVEIGYPNEGYIKVKAKVEGNYRIRQYDWMDNRMEITVNGQHAAPTYSDDCLYFPDINKGDVIRVAHRLDDVCRQEKVTDIDFTVKWRGPDVVELDPKGAPLQLYQRREGVDKQYPQPVGKSGGEISMKPTEQAK